MKAWVVAVAVSVMALPAVAQTQAPTAVSVAVPSDWGQALREDAQAFHDIILDSHPGPLDTENPGFNPLLEHGLELALQRAEAADTQEEWAYALAEYASSFDDGHLGLMITPALMADRAQQWPGFITGLRDGRHQVVFNPGGDGPPVGSVLIGCDGRNADALAAELLGRIFGRWALASQRASYARSLFVDSGDPYVRRPEQCDFMSDGVTRSYRLSWRELSSAVQDEGFAAARSPRYRVPSQARPWTGGVWIGLGGFDSDPAGEDGQAMTALIADLQSRADAVRAAPAVVFDLRGNNGGSSGWISQIAKVLWGETEVEARAYSSASVDWRVSAKNLAHLEHLKGLVAGNPELVAWVTRAADGMAAAQAAGQPFWRQTPEDDVRPSPPEQSRMQGRAYVFTDMVCASACLNAVDMLKALGAVHVGQETSADTLYMEVRQEVFPSRRVTAIVPVKVYRGRARGNNETAVPAHVWTGALSDTAGIEAWLAGIDAAAR